MKPQARNAGHRRAGWRSRQLRITAFAGQMAATRLLQVKDIAA